MPESYIEYLIRIRWACKAGSFKSHDSCYVNITSYQD